MLNFCFDSAEEVFIPLDVEIGMQAALEEHAGAAEIDGFLDLAEDRFARKNVAFPLWPSGPVERAEAANTPVQKFVWLILRSMM